MEIKVYEQLIKVKLKGKNNHINEVVAILMEDIQKQRKITVTIAGDPLSVYFSDFRTGRTIFFNELHIRWVNELNTYERLSEFIQLIYKTHIKEVRYEDRFKNLKSLNYRIINAGTIDDLNNEDL